MRVRGIAVAVLAATALSSCAGTDGSGSVGAGPAPDMAPPAIRVAAATRGPYDATPGAASPFPAMPLRLPDCRYEDAPAPRAAYDDWASTPVDTIWGLPETYIPPDLVPVSRAGLDGGGKIRQLVVDDVAALADAADAAGVPIAVQSAYRSYVRQAMVFAEWVSSSGEAEALRFSARPGHSEHQLGTTLDLREAAGPAPWQVAFAARPTGRWLAAHAWEYGFVVSYPEGTEARTCYGAEAWHVRYVGRDEAAAVAASGLTLREWLWQAVGPD